MCAFKEIFMSSQLSSIPLLSEVEKLEMILTTVIGEGRIV